MTILEKLEAGERTFTQQEYQDLCYEIFVAYESGSMSADIADAIVIDYSYYGQPYKVEG